MWINQKVFNNVVAIYLKGDVTIDMTSSFKETVEAAIKSNAKNLILDFSGADYICSAGLGVIANAYKEITPSGGKIYLTSVGEQIKRVLHTTALDHFILVRPDTDEIIAQLEASASPAEK